jgi:hypothetical protein
MKKTVKPISPEEIIDKLEDIIHPAIIQAVNKLLKSKFRGGYVTIKQKDIVEEAMKIDSTLLRKDIFENHWMDFEKVYKKYGWIVTYDRPGYNESYEPSYEFKPKEK